MIITTTTAPAVEPVSTAEVKSHLRLTTTAAEAAAYTTEDDLLDRLITVCRTQAEQETGRRFITQTMTMYLNEWPGERYIRVPYPPLQSATITYRLESEDVTTVAGTAVTITAMSLAYPTILTAVAHGLSNGDVVAAADFAGADAASINGNSYIIGYVTDDTFAIDFDSTDLTITDNTDSATMTPQISTYANTLTTADVDIVSEPGRIILQPNESWPSGTLYTNKPIKITFICGYGLAVAVPDNIKSAILEKISDLYENRGEVVIGVSVNRITDCVDSLLRQYRIHDEFEW